MSTPRVAAPTINILIVDDEPMNLMVLETVLDAPGQRLVRAHSAAEALLALATEEFALLILDVRMPGMNGFELARAIKGRKQTASVPIIFLSAHDTEGRHIAEGYEIGAVDFLHKPVDPAVLRSKVAVFAELYRRGREIAAMNAVLLDEVVERRQAEKQLVQLNIDLDQRVTERTNALSASNARLRLATDTVGLGIWSWQTGDDVWVWENDWFEASLGAGAAHQPKSAARLAADYLQDEDRAAFVQAIAASAHSGAALNFEGCMRAHDGSAHWIELIGDRSTEPGSAGQLMGTARDTSARHRAEETLRAREAELRDAHRRKDEFLAVLAHELRNPLAPVRNAVQILHLPGAVEPDMAWARDVIDRQVRMLARLIDDLMDVSRINQGRIELRREGVELSKVVEWAVEASRPQIEEFGHTLTIDLPQTSLLLDADLTRLSQVFMNLLINAAKFTDRGGRITLAVRQQDDEVVVMVTDNGIGMRADELRDVFVMFGQAKSAMERSRGGLGVGLALAERLIDMHGGRIAGTSGGPGCGSQFTVTLPLLASPGAAAGPTPAGRPACSSAEPDSLCIVVADDNRDGADTLAALLRLTGHEVHTVYDGVAGVEAAAEYRPQVVLLDIGMPRMNGYDACRQIRAQPWGPAMTLIAMTGWGDPEARRKVNEAGFDGHLVKPLDEQLLLSMLPQRVPKPRPAQGEI